MNASVPTKADVYAGTGLPELGFRNYWYPVLAAWRLRRRPESVRLLGEEVVLFRDRGRIYALRDRCAHRGARLSRGKCLYPGTGTLTCPYHGWTYSGETGRCVAKLMEGPDTAIPPEARVKSYPVRQHRGVIWLFVGDMGAVPLEDDLPECLADADAWHTISTWRTYRCNWRVLNDNLCYDLHAPFVHRNSPELVFQPVFPFASRIATTPLEGSKGLGYTAREGITEAVTPASEISRRRGRRCGAGSNPAAVARKWIRRHRRRQSGTASSTGTCRACRRSPWWAVRRATTSCAAGSRRSTRRRRCSTR